jgi:nucleoside-diphosphate-sugar epimerase
MITNKLPTIAISGASGFVGSALLDYFVTRGWTVVGLVRTPKKGKNPRVLYRTYDLTSPIGADTLAGVDYVVHAAYIKQSKNQPNALELNVAGAERLLAACELQKVKKSVFISSMSAHDKAKSIYGRQKLAIEELFLETGGLALRPGLIIGHGGIMQNMATFMKSKHIVPVVGGGKQPLQTIAIYDLAHIVEISLTSGIIDILTVATPTIYTYKAFYKALANSLHIRVLFIPVPYYLLLGIFHLAALVHLPLEIGADNLRGLKQLRSAETSEDLKLLNLKIDDLETALNTINEQNERKP